MAVDVYIFRNFCYDFHFSDCLYDKYTYNIFKILQVDEIIFLSKSIIYNNIFLYSNLLVNIKQKSYGQFEIIFVITNSHSFMKVKILAQLKKQFPGVANNLLDRIASHLEKTVTKEEDIETAVNGAAGLVKEFSEFHQSESDRRVTEAVQKRETELKAEYEKKTPKDKSDKTPEEIPAWAQAIVDSNKSLTDELAGFKTAQTQKSLSEKLVSALTEKKIPAKFFGKMVEGRTFKDEAEMLQFATTVETEYADFNQEMINSGLLQSQAPELGGKTKDGISTPVQAFVESKAAEQSGKAPATPQLGGKQL